MRTAVCPTPPPLKCIFTAGCPGWGGKGAHRLRCGSHELQVVLAARGSSVGIEKAFPKVACKNMWTDGLPTGASGLIADVL